LQLGPHPLQKEGRLLPLLAAVGHTTTGTVSGRRAAARRAAAGLMMQWS